MSLGVKEFSDCIYEKLVELEDTVMATAPSTTSEFPCREMQAPLKTINKTGALETFQISIKHWNDTLANVMEMTDVTDSKLLEYNLIRTNTSSCTLNTELQKYELTTTYEVRYNALTNAFQLIK